MASVGDSCLRFLGEMAEGPAPLDPLVRVLTALAMTALTLLVLRQTTARRQTWATQIRLGYLSSCLASASVAALLAGRLGSLALSLLYGRGGA